MGYPKALTLRTQTWEKGYRSSSRTIWNGKISKPVNMPLLRLMLAASKRRMDADEVLRLTQITGLAEMFKDREFSEAWAADVISESDTLTIAEEIPA